MSTSNGKLNNWPSDWRWIKQKQQHCKVYSFLSTLKKNICQIQIIFIAITGYVTPKGSEEISASRNREQRAYWKNQIQTSSEYALLQIYLQVHAYALWQFIDL